MAGNTSNNADRIEDPDPFGRLKDRIRESDIPDPGKNKAMEVVDLMRLSSNSQGLLERAMEYVDWLLKFPWIKRAPIEKQPLDEIERSLREGFFGHENIIETVLDQVAVGSMCDGGPPFRLCFVFPVPVGPTKHKRNGGPPSHIEPTAT